MPSSTLTKFGYPATLIGESEHWTVLLRPQQVTLGSLVLVCREPVTRFGAVSPAAFAGLQAIVAQVETMLQCYVRYEKINYLMLMMVDPDVHFHVIPRYQGERCHGPDSFPDAGWPGPPLLAQAVEPHTSLRDDITRQLRRLWAKPSA
ncbi:HIT family protein [Siccirubricoccus phaeus]|uniref:HIT family protein n=1 Tax=Siccirubricoccus phaeus TaxID=2595053 RepID=UPI0011F2C092|nr:HIT family protein [Siccirubricoccus phaeus]